MAEKYITQSKLKKNTLSDIFIIILNKKQTTRREIEYETGFSWGTVSSNIAFLLEKGYIVEEKSEQSGNVGRSTYTLKPASEGIVSIGLDINRSGLSCEVVGLDSSVKNNFTADFSATTQNELIREAENICQRAIEWCKNNEQKIFSMGIAIQGAVDGRHGISLKFPGISDWKAYNIKDHFAQKFDLPVYLGHDPKCMLLGEICLQKSDNCLLVRIDDGIGMAVSLDGKILDDTERLEIGHTVSVPNGKICSCGKRGCLEKYASVSAIAESANTSKAEIFACPEKYESEITDAGDHMSLALYNMYVIFKPQKMILTSDCVHLEKYVERAISLVKNEDLEICIKHDVSAAYGAAVESMKSAVKAFVI
ncbi:MAG: ROK family protein [Clostridia bacterium]|nr:ROK family protein [Clostridia bacterium]